MKYVLASNKMGQALRELIKWCGPLEDVNIEFCKEEVWLSASANSQARVKVNSKGKGTFLCALPADVISDITYGRPIDYTFTSPDKNTLKFSGSGKIVGKIPILDYNETHPIPESIRKQKSPNISEVFNVLKSVTIGSQFSKESFAVPNSILRRKNNLVTAASADYGHIAYVEEKNPIEGENFEIKIPSEYAKIITGALRQTDELFFGVDNNGIYVWNNEQEIAFPLIDLRVLELEEIQEVIWQDPIARVEVKNIDLFETTVRLGKISDKRTQINIINDSLKFRAVDQKRGEIVDKLPVENSKGKAEIKVNPHFMLDCMGLLHKADSNGKCVFEIHENHVSIISDTEEARRYYVILGVS